MDFLTQNNFGLFILIMAPGFLSIKIWSLIHPSRRLSSTGLLYEAIFYGAINYFLIVWWLPPLLKEINSILEIVAYILSLGIFPIFIPFLWKLILSLSFIRNKIINPIPKAWDSFFGKRKPCFMIVHIKNGQVIGGLYAYDSAASSYPEKEDLYLQEIWELDDDGKFTKPVDGTMGLLVSCESIDYIELFNAQTRSS
jgi:hypothetical protein